jgi:predicted SAM-dependent methyltransferase
MKLVNLGCGSRYHADWINFDIVPAGPGVIACDLASGIPLPDGSCDAVYHSHLLEHIRREEAPGFMKECCRVLRPGGIVRVAVPDLERIARLYLDRLASLCDGDAGAADDYEWIMLEMFDQTVRERSGGRMLEYLKRDPIPNEEFICERLGEEARSIIGALRKPAPPASAAADPAAFQPSGGSSHGLLHRVRRRLKRMRSSDPSRLRDRHGDALSSMSPEDRTALRIGRFRLAGEVHQWMYDRYSLGRLLLAAGFVDPLRQRADTSRIADWSSYNLDTSSDGTVVKPDSLYMEGVKPA